MRRLVVLFSAATLSLVGGVIATSAVASGSTATTEPSSAATEAPAATEASASTAGAAETTEAAAPSTAPHPLVGAWLIDEVPYVISFQSDGTVQEVDSGNGQIGVWEAAGPNSGLVTTIAVVSEADGGGPAKFRATFEVSSDGQSVTIDWEGELLREGAPAEELGPGSQTGTRINVEPMGTSAEASATSAPTTSN